jgi:hypothetical protein
MKSLLRITFFSILFPWIIFSCTKDEPTDCVSTGRAIVAQFTGAADSGSVNQTVSVTVNWTYLNGCDNFAHFEQTVSGKTITIRTFASHNKCNSCSSSSNYKSVAYSFTPADTGTYSLKFLQPDDNLASVKTVIVY